MWVFGLWLAGADEGVGVVSLCSGLVPLLLLCAMVWCSLFGLCCVWLLSGGGWLLCGLPVWVLQCVAGCLSWCF